MWIEKATRLHQGRTQDSVKMFFRGQNPIFSEEIYRKLRSKKKVFQLQNKKPLHSLRKVVGLLRCYVSQPYQYFSRMFHLFKHMKNIGNELLQQFG